MDEWNFQCQIERTLLRFNLNFCDSHKILKRNLIFNFYQKLKRTPLQIDPKQKERTLVC